MLKLRAILLGVMAGGILVSLPSVASAQLPQSAVNQLTPKYRQQGPCRDPWVTIAINDVFANTHTIQGKGEWGECDHSRYGNAGSWSSYAELYQSVRTAFNNMSAAQITITKQALPNGNWKITTSGRSRQFLHNDIVSNDGGTLITSDGASLAVASVVSQGGGNRPGSTMTVSQRNTFAVSDSEMRVYLGGSVLIMKK